jgi:hypothetical protein
VSTGTAIRPLGNDEYDVDVIYPLRLTAWKEEHRNPVSIFRWFASRIEGIPAYKGKTAVKSRCVRVNFAGDFHMDIIPSTKEVAGHAPWAVPTKDLANWLTNDPIGLAKWVREKDAASGMRDGDGDGVFVRSVRYLKRWRDHFFGTDPRPSSILMVTILGRHEASIQSYSPPLPDPSYASNKRDAAYLYDLLRLTHGCTQREESKAFEHPTIAGEDLRRGWDAAFRERFLERVAASVRALKRGIDATNEAEAIEAYKAALGDTFPSG